MSPPRRRSRLPDVAATGTVFGMDAEAFGRHIGRMVREHVDRRLAPLVQRIESLEAERDSLLELVTELQAEREGD